MWTQICTMILNGCEREVFGLVTLKSFSSVTSYVSSSVIVPLYFYYTLHFYIYPKEPFHDIPHIISSTSFTSFTHIPTHFTSWACPDDPSLALSCFSTRPRASWQCHTGRAAACMLKLTSTSFHSASLYICHIIISLIISQSHSHIVIRIYPV